MKRDFRKIFKMSEFLDPDEILADSASALRHAEFTEGKIERPLKNLSAFIFLGTVAILFGYFIHRAYFLQIKNGEAFFLKSQENRFTARPIFPPRGLIYDRTGEMLVENKPSFGLLWEKERFMKNGGNFSLLLKTLKETLGLNEKQLAEMGLSAEKNAGSLPRRLILARELTPEQLIAATSRLDSMPGTEIYESFQRIYRDAEAFSHLLGFVGKVAPEDLALNSRLEKEETVGRAALESFYDDILRGKSGKKIVEVDASGKETNFRIIEKPSPGADVAVAIDGKLQEMAYRTVKNYVASGKAASVVMLDPRNGEIRSLLSFPGYDSNSMGRSMTPEELKNIAQNPLKPFFNRAISGEFPPGSTIKPLIGAAALEEKIIDPRKQIYDEGFISLPNPYRPGEESVFPDWKKHGLINFYDAIAFSANVYFYIVGGGYKNQDGLGIERIKNYAGLFGLGSRLGIDLPGEKSGLVPDPQTKKISEPENPIWRIGDTYNVSIGQGGFKATPLQMASVTSAIANGGKLYRPHILKAVLDKNSAKAEEEPPRIIRENMASEKTLAEVRRGMRETVVRGTARLLNSLPVAAAAKTGTAQTGKGLLPHAWVTAFAPLDRPEIAVTVMVENAGEGATVAVPITYEIMKWYFENRKP